MKIRVDKPLFFCYTKNVKGGGNHKMKAFTMRDTLEKFNDILIEIIFISCYNNYRKLGKEQ